MAQQLVTGVALETLNSGGTTAARITELVVEALHGGASLARISDVGIEALHTGRSTARISSTAIEVLQSIPHPAPRRVVMILE